MYKQKTQVILYFAMIIGVILILGGFYLIMSDFSHRIENTREQVELNTFKLNTSLSSDTSKEAMLNFLLKEDTIKMELLKQNNELLKKLVKHK
jgi:hypothetical protein